MKIFSVGQVNNYIKNIISQDYMLKSIVIKGEVSNCKYHSMGHIYFSLKDSTGSIPAVMFKGNTERGLSFTLREGQSVVVYGSINVYERDGRYQLYASKITMDGTGKLYEELERLKQRLNEEGLFDPDNKKSIPAFPRRIGVVTAKTGAAIQDIINIARRRNPYVQLVLYPAKVQGEGAADTIVRGIQVLDSMDMDTIIIGRGGGSIEDLWAFNEEKVVRAVYEARTPIISGTGHEIDTTLADYAADRRAPTPSAACEMAVPDIMSIIERLRSISQNIKGIMDNRLMMYDMRLKQYKLKLDKLSPASKLLGEQQYLSELYDRLRLGMDRKYQSMEHRCELLTMKLHGLSPTARLINGFGYIEHKGEALTDVSKAEAGDDLSLTISNGTIKATVREVTKRDE